MPSYSSRFSRSGSMNASNNQPRPSGPVLGPPKMQMPKDASMEMPKSSDGLGHTSTLGSANLKPLPSAPLGPFKTPAPSLLNVPSNKQRKGVGGFGNVGNLHYQGFQ